MPPKRDWGDMNMEELMELYSDMRHITAYAIKKAKEAEVNGEATHGVGKAAVTRARTLEGQFRQLAFYIRERQKDAVPEPAPPVIPEAPPKPPKEPKRKKEVIVEVVGPPVSPRSRRQRVMERLKGLKMTTDRIEALQKDIDDLPPTPEPKEPKEPKKKKVKRVIVEDDLLEDDPVVEELVVEENPPTLADVEAVVEEAELFDRVAAVDVVDDFEYATKDELAEMSLKQRKKYERRLKAHKAMLTAKKKFLKDMEENPAKAIAAKQRADTNRIVERLRSNQEIRERRQFKRLRVGGERRKRQEDRDMFNQGKRVKRISKRKQALSEAEKKRMREERLRTIGERYEGWKAVPQPTGPRTEQEEREERRAEEATDLYTRITKYLDGKSSTFKEKVMQNPEMRKAKEFELLSDAEQQRALQWMRKVTEKMKIRTDRLEQEEEMKRIEKLAKEKRKAERELRRLQTSALFTEPTRSKRTERVSYASKKPLTAEEEEERRERIRKEKEKRHQRNLEALQRAPPDVRSEEEKRNKTRVHLEKKLEQYISEGKDPNDYKKTFHAIGDLLGWEPNPNRQYIGEDSDGPYWPEWMPVKTADGQTVLINTYKTQISSNWWSGVPGNYSEYVHRIPLTKEDPTKKFRDDPELLDRVWFWKGNYYADFKDFRSWADPGTAPTMAKYKDYPQPVAIVNWDSK